MNKEQKIISILESQKPTLSKEERSSVWSVVAKHLPVPHAAQKTLLISPYFSLFAFSRQVAVVVAIVLFVSTTGGVAFASNAARPGDMLFSVDRALEHISLRFTKDEEKRSALKNKLSQERLQEFRAILEEELVYAQKSSTSTRFRDDGQLRLNTAVKAIVEFLDESDIDDNNRGNLISEVAREFTMKNGAERHDDGYKVRDEQNKIEVEIDDDGRSRFEARDGEHRIRIEEKDGELKIRKSHNGERISDNDDNGDRENSKDKNSRDGDTDTVVKDLNEEKSHVRSDDGDKDEENKKSSDSGDNDEDGDGNSGHGGGDDR